MITKKNRSEFVSVIRKYVGSPLSQVQRGENFIWELRKINPEWFYPHMIEDRSLNAALGFCSYYFDALEHRFEDLGPGSGITIPEAREKLDDFLKILSQEDGEITDPRVMEFYYKPQGRLWRFVQRLFAKHPRAPHLR